MPFKPNFILTTNMAGKLMEIQNACTLIEYLPLPSYILKDLKRKSMVETVILSTKLEGNFLDEKRKMAAINNANDILEEQEVHNLWKAMEFLEESEKRKLPITEELVKKLHAIIQVISSGRRPKMSEYRTVQNKVSEKGTGNIVYLPPEPHDVPLLVEDLIAWINNPDNSHIPAPIKAGIFLYQFLTIHPYMDVNGRTGRALATYILRLAGLGLNGLFVLERYYDRNLSGYYNNLQMDLHHNYYFGRNNADITPWLEFFITGLAEVCLEAAKIVKEKSAEFTNVEPALLRDLDVYQRSIFAQLAFKNNYLTTTDLRRLTDLADRTIREKVKTWIEKGFLVPYDPKAKRIRAVTLAPQYEKLAKQISKESSQYKYLIR